MIESLFIFWKERFPFHVRKGVRVPEGLGVQCPKVHTEMQRAILLWNKKYRRRPLAIRGSDQLQLQQLIQLLLQTTMFLPGHPVGAAGHWYLVSRGDGMLRTMYYTERFVSTKQSEKSSRSLGTWGGGSGSHSCLTSSTSMLRTISFF